MDLARERWEAGRERAGLPLEGDVGVASGSGDVSVRATAGTPRARLGKGKQMEGVNLSESLRQSTKKKYDPFDSPIPGSAGRETIIAKVMLKTNGKVKGRIKDNRPGDSNNDEAEELAAASTAAQAVTSGLLAGYGSDGESESD